MKDKNFSSPSFPNEDLEEKEKKQLNTEELERQLKECQKLKDEYLIGWKKERATFLNYKKEEAIRISELKKFGNEESISKILPILDVIYVAEKKLPRNLEENQWAQGILRIKTQFLDILEKQGIEEIKCLGEKFDPNFHEIVGEVEKRGFEPEIIIEEVKRGYLFHGKVLRPARVKISK